MLNKVLSTYYQCIGVPHLELFVHPTGHKHAIIPGVPLYSLYRVAMSVTTPSPHMTHLGVCEFGTASAVVKIMDDNITSGATGQQTEGPSGRK